MGVRFKLLALVPAVSLAVLLGLYEETIVQLSRNITLLISIFGLVVTFGIYMYDIRNSELYDDLISRGKKIEEELGIETGQFLGRPSGKKRFHLITFYHDRALKLIYWPTLLAWLFSILYFLILL